MDRKKLEKSADDFAHGIPDIGGGGDYDVFHVMDAFEEGAEWLMQQPLSERLTDEEKKKINKLQEEIYGEIMCAYDDDDWQSAAYYILDVMPRTFTSNFGSELFK